MTQTVAFIGAREASRVLGVDRSTLTRWVQSGRIDAAGRLEGGTLLFDPVVIEAFAAERASLIGAREACRVLGVDRSTLTRWVQSGRIDAAGGLEGGTFLFDPVVIEALAAERAS